MAALTSHACRRRVRLRERREHRAASTCGCSSRRTPRAPRYPLADRCGRHRGVDLGKSYASVAEAVDTAGADNWTPLYGVWYADLFEEGQNSVGGVVTGAITVDEMIETMQALTDEIRENPDIPKLTREAPAS